MKTFEQAWSEQKAQGYDYGYEALENVRFGWELALAAIRALPTAIATAPIIAVIGGDADEARECLDAGCDTVLRKPVTVAGVARAVADAAARVRQDTILARSVA